MKVQRGSSSSISLILIPDWDGWLIPRPGCFTPGKETRYILHRKLSGSQDRYGGNIAPTGIRSVDFRARRDFLYLLPYPGRIVSKHKINILKMKLFSNFLERQ